MQRVWLIRAGNDAEELDPMRSAGLIGVRYLEVGDATTMTSAEIEQALVDANRAAPGQLRAEIQSFANEVKLGDLVVTPNTNRGEVWLSVITGSYQFDPYPAIDGYFHTRTVDWLGWLDREARWMNDQLKVIDRPVMLAELYNREWWWKHLDAKELTTVPRAPQAASIARSAASSSRTRTPRPASASRPKPPVKPKPPTRPKPTEMILCAGQCGLQWAPQVLIDGLCPDCRGD